MTYSAVLGDQRQDGVGVLNILWGQVVEVGLARWLAMVGGVGQA